MLFSYNFIHKHPTRKLNQHLKYFFRRLKDVDENSTFIPLNKYFHPDFVTHLNRASELKQKFESFFEEFKHNSSTVRENLIEQFYKSQDIKNILENITFNGAEIRKDAIPLKLREITADLFKHMYPGTLNSIGNLKDHYKQLYDSLTTKTCPFCGIESMQIPHYARQDYDHILNQGHYPFAAINLNNLAPIGKDCNQTYKKAKDVLYSGAQRRRYAYPYSTSFNIEVILNGSLLPDRSTNFKGTWVIGFTPANDFVSTWVDVFEIKYRYGELILSTHFDSWLDHFIDNIKERAITVNTTTDLVRQFQIDANLYLKRPHLEFNIVKGGLFRFLATCNDLAFYSSMITRINS